MSTKVTVYSPRHNQPVIASPPGRVGTKRSLGQTVDDGQWASSGLSGQGSEVATLGEGAAEDDRRGTGKGKGCDAGR